MAIIGLFRLSAGSLGNGKFIGESDEFGQRSGIHFSHDLSAMYSDRDFAGSQIHCGLLVGKAGYNERKDFAFPGRQEFVALSQFTHFGTLLTCLPIESNTGLDSL